MRYIENAGLKSITQTADIAGHMFHLFNDAEKSLLNRPCHVCSVTTHIEVGPLLQQLPDQLPALLYPVLNVHLLGLPQARGNLQQGQCSI